MARRISSPLVIKSDWVTNWRAKVVYNPEVLRRLQEGVLEAAELEERARGADLPEGFAGL